MEVFVASQSLVWLAVVGYVGWLHARQRRLLRIVGALETRMHDGGTTESGHADIAA